VAVAESAAGGLISAALVAVPGASAYYLGGSVIYTQASRRGILHMPDEAYAGMRASTEPYALLNARSIRDHVGATWGLGRLVRAAPRAIAMVMTPATPASPWPVRSSARLL